LYAIAPHTAWVAARRILQFSRGEPEHGMGCSTGICRLAFMFLVREEIFHEKLWELFFRGNEHRYAFTSIIFCRHEADGNVLTLRDLRNP
jgi:hypothetical protein